MMSSGRRGQQLLRRSRSRAPRRPRRWRRSGPCARPGSSPPRRGCRARSSGASRAGRARRSRARARRGRRAGGRTRGPAACRCGAVGEAHRAELAAARAQGDDELVRARGRVVAGCRRRSISQRSAKLGVSRSRSAARSMTSRWRELGVGDQRGAADQREALAVGGEPRLRVRGGDDAANAPAAATSASAERASRRAGSLARRGVDHAHAPVEADEVEHAAAPRPGRARRPARRPAPRSRAPSTTSRMPAESMNVTSRRSRYTSGRASRACSICARTSSTVTRSISPRGTTTTPSGVATAGDLEVRLALHRGRSSHALKR